MGTLSSLQVYPVEFRASVFAHIRETSPYFHLGEVTKRGVCHNMLADVSREFPHLLITLEEFDCDTGCGGFYLDDVWQRTVVGWMNGVVVWEYNVPDSVPLQDMTRIPYELVDAIERHAYTRG